MDKTASFHVVVGMVIALFLPSAAGIRSAWAQTGGPGAADLSLILGNKDLQRLGEKLFFDESFSAPSGQSCATCHDPEAGWSGPDDKINRAGAVYPGAIHDNFGKGFVKSYEHNGYFKSLQDIVHFYNTRDVLPPCEAVKERKPGVNCWPAPEVPQNINEEELGDLKLSPQEEGDIVEFLKTLSDGYKLP